MTHFPVYNHLYNTDMTLWAAEGCKKHYGTLHIDRHGNVFTDKDKSEQVARFPTTLQAASAFRGAGWNVPEYEKTDWTEVKADV